MIVLEADTGTIHIDSDHRHKTKLSAGTTPNTVIKQPNANNLVNFIRVRGKDLRPVSKRGSTYWPEHKEQPLIYYGPIN